MKQVYRSGHQGVKVRGLLLFSIVVALGTYYAAYDIALHLGLAPADGGHLQPLWVRLSTAGFISLLASAFVAGMAYYGRHYIDRIDWDESARQFEVRMIGSIGTRTLTFAPAEVQSVEEHHDAFDMRMPHAQGTTINAPWRSIKLRGHASNLILDDQGEFTHDVALVTLLRNTLGETPKGKVR
jgi:hypothetical protein